MEQTMKCPICGENMNLKEVLRNKRNTSNVVQDYNTDKRDDLGFYVCPVCDHGRINDVLDEGFYQDFSVALVGTDDEATNNYRASKYKPFVEKLAKLAPDTDSIFEIGSGCGYLLKAAMEKFSKVLGVEPSEKEYEVSTEIAKGCMVINDFFMPSLNLERGYSAFVATMVFEHLPDPKESMLYSYEILKNGGVGLIQVPNGQRTVNQGVYYEVYSQHLHYFTPLSLAKLAVESGFDILSLEEDPHRNYLEMYVKKNEENHVTYSEKEESERRYFADVIEKYRNISIWGASYVARTCLDLISAERIRHFFDMSDVKAGKYISGFSKIIEIPDAEKVNENELIIVFANEYIQDILKVMDRFGYKGKVLCYDDECSIKFFR